MIGLIFYNLIGAELVFYAVSGDYDDVSMFWYEDNSIKVKGDFVYVWQRTRYGKVSSVGNRSHKDLNEINCNEYSIRHLKRFYFSDGNWINKTSSKTEFKKKIIHSDSVMKKLADRVCRK